MRSNNYVNTYTCVRLTCAVLVDLVEASWIRGARLPSGCFFRVVFGAAGLVIRQANSTRQYSPKVRYIFSPITTQRNRETSLSEGRGSTKRNLHQGRLSVREDAPLYRRQRIQLIRILKYNGCGVAKQCSS